MGLRAYTLGLLLTLSLSFNSHAQNITDDTYFYGQSPSVEPSRMAPLCWSSLSSFSDFVLAPGTGSGDWASAYQKAKAFVGKLTQDEKITLTAGVAVDNSCSGNIAPIARLGFPGFCVSDAGNGLVCTEKTNLCPC